MSAVTKLLLVVATAAATPPNFIYFQPDEMRAESLGCYGHPIASTPNFDAFAKQGTRFDQAHVSYTVCSQSRTAFMTAWPTHVRGHRTLWSLLHDWEPNLLKYFKTDANYTVKWWGKNDLLAPDAWNRSVTSAISKHGKPNNGPNKYKPTDPEFFTFLSEPTEYGAENTTDYANVAAAIDFLRAYKAGVDAPFFIFLPLSKPHPPYTCPEPFYSSVNPDSLPPLRPMDSPKKPDYHALIRSYRNMGTLDEKFFRKLHAVYLGSIAFSDFLFGLLLAAVDEAKLADSTTITVFADHGDYAGDYGLVEKWPSGLEDVLTRVPLIIRTPGGTPGHVVAEPVQLFDIVPVSQRL
jgi:choline-sulfatase